MRRAFQIKFQFFKSSVFPFQEAFSDIALFFHDVYGGDFVGVVWKPHSFVPAHFKVQQAFCFTSFNCHATF